MTSSLGWSSWEDFYCLTNHLLLQQQQLCRGSVHRGQGIWHDLHWLSGASFPQTCIICRCQQRQWAGCVSSTHSCLSSSPYTAPRMLLLGMNANCWYFKAPTFLLLKPVTIITAYIPHLSASRKQDMIIGSVLM